jgi:hypothetical protein
VPGTLTGVKPEQPEPTSMPDRGGAESEKWFERYLRPRIRHREIPLVVVLANPKGFHIDLSVGPLIKAMLGNPGYSGQFDPETGSVDQFETSGSRGVWRSG